MTIAIFDDQKSFFHVLMGVPAGLFIKNVGILIILAFTVYQLTETESMAAKVGDFIEFFVGMVLGGAIYYALS
ncbi:MAG: hypothetical protein QXE51_03360 [Nitrososphaeria archaeon]